MGIFGVIIFCLLLVAFLWEKHQLNRCRAKFLHVIHVNGIRGKTSVCRLLDAMLREKYRVYTKTTGTNPQVIDTSGIEHPLNRRGCPNIREQIRIMRRAEKERAEILIVECMAINPLLQYASQHQILNADIGVITNVRHDHIFDMGQSLDEIAASLSNTIPKNGQLFSGAVDFAQELEHRCTKKGTTFKLACPHAKETHSENHAIAYAVAQTLGLNDKQIALGSSKIKQDFGTSMEYQLTAAQGHCIKFLNLFSVNDPLSTMMHLRNKEKSSIYFLYNHRRDRPDRLVLFAQSFFPNWQGSTVFLMGHCSALAKRILRKTPNLNVITVFKWQDCLNLPKNSLLVGIGNIHGMGADMIKTLDRGLEHVN